MAIGFIFELPGATAAQYDSLMDTMKLNGAMGEGGLSHMAAPMDGGWRVVDLWESQAAFDKFFSEKLGPALQSTGLPVPNITVLDVHNYITT